MSKGFTKGSIIAEDETDSGDDEYEGEDPGDEYADELRAVAESHEAMSRRDDQANRTETRSNNSQDSEKNLDTPKKDFDSKEKSVESGSDESDSSNETLLDEGEPEDEEVISFFFSFSLINLYKKKRKHQNHFNLGLFLLQVTELMKYKNTNHFRLKDDSAADVKRKRKRVPTVKKELSTQAEIKSGVNVSDSDSDIEKRFKTKELLDELNGQFKSVNEDNDEPCNGGTTPISKEVNGTPFLKISTLFFYFNS